MKTEAVDLGFKVAKKADHTAFSVAGEGVGPGFWSASILMGLIFGGMMGIAVGTVAFVVIFGISLAIPGMMSSDRAREQRFKVFDDTILVGGKRYAKADISEILIRNGTATVTAAQAGSSGLIVGGTGVTGAALAVGTAAAQGARNIGASGGQAMAESLQKRSFTVAFRHGSKLVPLAKSLTEARAVSLFNEVQRVI